MLKHFTQSDNNTFKIVMVIKSESDFLQFSIFNQTIINCKANIILLIEMRYFF